MRNKRKSFLIDSNQSLKKRKSWGRSRLVHVLFQLFFVKQFAKILKKSFFFGLICLGLFGFLGFAVFSPYFKLKKISVVRDNPNIDAQQVEISLDAFYGKNLLFLRRQEIHDVLKKAFPAFEAVQFKELWPDAIELQVGTVAPMFNILNQETADFYIVSENGSILATGADKLLPTLKIFGYKKRIVPHQPFTTREVLEKIITAKNLLTQKLTLPLSALHFYPDAQELHLISKQDMQIWLDLQLPIDLQMEKLELSANRVGLYSHALKHVDLRIPNQLFWAPK